VAEAEAVVVGAVVEEVLTMTAEVEEEIVAGVAVEVALDVACLLDVGHALLHQQPALVLLEDTALAPRLRPVADLRTAARALLHLLAAPSSVVLRSVLLLAHLPVVGTARHLPLLLVAGGTEIAAVRLLVDVEYLQDLLLPVLQVDLGLLLLEATANAGEVLVLLDAEGAPRDLRLVVTVPAEKEKTCGDTRVAQAQAVVAVAVHLVVTLRLLQRAWMWTAKAGRN